MRTNPETAAKAMGYCNTATISKMERDGSKVPINHNYCHRLAQWAGVSLDFLYGYSEYPERDPQTVEQMAIFNNAKAFTQSYFELFGKLLIGSVEANTLTFEVGKVCEAFKVFEGAWLQLLKLNPSFEEEARGGAKAVSAIELMRKAVNEARQRAEMIKFDNKSVRQLESALSECQHSPQMDFVGFGRVGEGVAINAAKKENQQRNK